MLSNYVEKHIKLIEKQLKRLKNQSIHMGIEVGLHLGDCNEVLKTIPSNSIDAVITDPPYGLAFMNKKWDYDVPSIATWIEIIRVLKPGGHLLAFGGTRTYHRMVCNIEDAGFEIRDQIQWLYGSGFPKSLDISKAIDKMYGAEREVLSEYKRPDGTKRNYEEWSGKKTQDLFDTSSKIVTSPSTDLAKKWEGFGTALKPANEPIVLARKPLSESTVAKNVLKWGTGGLNIDGCRVGTGKDKGSWPLTDRTTNRSSMSGAMNHSETNSSVGRFPANLILDEVAAEMLDEQSGDLKTNPGKYKEDKDIAGKIILQKENKQGYVTSKGDSGGASRFFYCAKTSKRERGTNNGHPCVKPLKLMSYLCRLITPPNGTILDPFMGSGSTGVAAKNEGFKFIGIEKELEYFEIAKKRIEVCKT